VLAASRKILVGGSAPPVQKIGGVGGQKLFSEIPAKISFYPQHLLMTHFSHRSKIATK